MKTMRLTLTALLGLAAVAGVQASEQDQASSRVEVVFSNPDQFTDAADGPRGSDIGRESILNELRKHIVRRASARLPEGQRLTVTVTDVDLAGEIEPWRTGSASNVRIVKDIYFPRMDLTYRVTDASGAVVKEGTSRLRDMNFQNNINPMRSEPRFHEFALIDDWVRQEFGAAKKKK